ncbi:hypothetical protein EG68_00319 [Paragonimus skrjabini miyazakii]|uniref:Uncharacterized protein n=1 Tax=Paragonimus skrjabini miyazakii TaxID=59628 RepID=A0A8S9ZCR8_9TREM|nr:hypothetical protein EG68_00319 [Paragonimus skrjabini miyazakii]
MASTSTSIFPLTYLGNSVLQSTSEDELETIYELLFTYYLDFLRKVVTQFKRVQSFTDIMCEAYSTVVMAVGNGHLILRFISTEKCGDQTFRKHLEKKFTPDELVYFNCYYMEVVIPMGRGGRKCFAYFRRAVDTRRCVPEDALLELDDQLSAWLLHNRHIPRPPLVYCIVSSQKRKRTLICHVFLADNTQVGLQTIRCLSELRQSVTALVHETIPHTYNSPRGQVGRKPRNICTHQHGARQLRSQSNDSRLTRLKNSLCTKCDSLASSNYKIFGFNNHFRRSHATLYDQNELRPPHPVCDHSFCQNCGDWIYSVSSDSESEGDLRRRLQVRLGREALDYYQQRRRQYSMDRLMNSDLRHSAVQQRFAQLSMTDPSIRNTHQPTGSRLKTEANLTNQNANKKHGLDSKTSQLFTTTLASHRPRPSRSAESRRAHLFHDSSLALLP